jgi:hypothetical protein
MTRSETALGCTATTESLHMDNTRYQARLALGSELPSILVRFMLPAWPLLSVKAPALRHLRTGSWSPFIPHSHTVPTFSPVYYHRSARDVPLLVVRSIGSSQQRYGNDFVEYFHSIGNPLLPFAFGIMYCSYRTLLVGLNEEKLEDRLQLNREGGE